MASLRKNIYFNYAGQIYSTFIGIAVLPLFLSEVGAEAYGLIGFYTLVQAWMSLLDIGMTPTLGREVARLRDCNKEGSRLVTIVNSLELVFFIIALCVAYSMFWWRDWLASDWLTVQVLDLSFVEMVVAIIGCTVAVRWSSSLNRSGINAFEHQVWLNVFEIILNTLRFPGALLLIIVLKGNVAAYFYFQLVLVVVEFFCLRWKFRRLLPDVAAKRFSLPELKRIAPFAVSIGYTAAIWVLLTQLDKLVLSKTLPLSEFGYFTLIATVCSGVIMLSGPISKAILPRMTALLAVGKKDAMIQIYKKSTAIVVVVVMPIALTIASFPYNVIYVWTGNEEASNWAVGLLPLFVMGAAVLSVVSFQYYLQYAYGNLRWHVIYNTGSVLFNVPLIVFLALEYGPVGVAWLWFLFRLFSLLFWVPFVHKKFAPGLNQEWFFSCVLVPTALSVLTVFLCAELFGDINNLSRFYQLLILASVAVFAFLASAGGSYISLRGKMSE